MKDKEKHTSLRITGRAAYVYEALQEVSHFSFSDWCEKRLVEEFGEDVKSRVFAMERDDLEEEVERLRRKIEALDRKLGEH